MRTGIKIVTHASMWVGREQTYRIYNYLHGMAEIRDIKRRGRHHPLATGSEEGQMVVHYPFLLLTRKGSR